MDRIAWKAERNKERANKEARKVERAAALTAEMAGQWEDLCCVRPPTGAFLTSQPEPENVKQLATSSLFLRERKFSHDRSFMRPAGRGFSTAALKQKKAGAAATMSRDLENIGSAGNNAFDARPKRGGSSKRTIQDSDRK